MKSSFGLVLIIMVFVVLGCNMFGKKDEKIDKPPGTDSSPQATASTPKSPASSSGLTMENYEKIKNGMSYQEVVELLGSGGEETRRSTIGNLELKSYKWEGDNYKRVYVNFRDGKVNSKTKTGLK